LRVALEDPERVASVAVYEPVTLRILFDYNRRHRAASEVAEIADNIRRALIGGNARRAAERFFDYWAGTPQWTRLTPERQAAFAQRMPVILSHFVSLRHEIFRLRDYANVMAPVLYLSDRDTRSSARRISELLSYTLPDVEHDILSDMGHLGPITHGDVVAQRIARFVYRHAEGWPVQERKAA
jgi:pimeloyl-ACP methyl ester carboxylesterase